MPTPIHDIYNPLYLNEDKFIVLVTGGRGSGKSYEVSRFIERLTFEIGHKILFSRYTMTSADKSVIPEVHEKILTDGTQDYFRTTQDRIINERTNSEIIFMGIKASSGNQTAKLKSIQGLSVFVCDEAEEWESEEEFDKLVLSIRKKGVKNTVIIVMNPCSTSHFIYQKYIKDSFKLVDYLGVPVQISTHPNVLHIHTTYQDNLEYLSPEFLEIVEDMEENNPEKYARVIAGQWSKEKKGLIFPKYEIVDELPVYLKKVAIGLDFGYTNHQTAGVKCGVVGNNLYIDELFYKRGMKYRDIAEALIDEDYSVIADSAEPRGVDEIEETSKALGKKVNIYSVKKPPGSVEAGILKMQDMNIKVTRRSKNLIYELDNYTWEVDRFGEVTNKPIQENDHAIDASRYYVYGYLLGNKKQERKCWSGI